MLNDAPSREMLILKEPVGWEDAVPFPRIPSENTFISGDLDSQTIRLRYFKNASTRQLAARVWFGPKCEGPPGHAHGGSQAAVLDEGMGGVAWQSGHSVLAAKIEINFRAPLRLGTTLTMIAEIDRVEGKKVYSRAKLIGDDGTLFSDSSGLFVVIDTEKFMGK